MKIKIKDITIPWYAPREKVDDDYINDLMRSLEEYGQWNPIMVRLNENKEYELISGLQRVSAAKKIGLERNRSQILLIQP
nr:ParB N-terminal domain-containing protein [Methanobacterium formicicum]